MTRQHKIKWRANEKDNVYERDNREVTENNEG